MVYRDLRCRRIDVTQAPGEFGDGSLFGQVGLAEEQAVGHRHLLDGLGVLRELAGAVRDIDHGDDAVDAETFGDEEVFHQRVDHRRRIGQTGRLDEHAADWRDLAVQAAQEEVGQAARQVAAHRAAEAAGVEHDQLFVDFGDQVMIHRDAAEFVDQYGRVGHLRLAEEVVEQRRFAGTEKTGEQRDRDAAFTVSGGHGVVAMGQGVRRAFRSGRRGRTRCRNRRDG